MANEATGAAGRVRTFRGSPVVTGRDRVLMPVPFSPDDEWGVKPAHPVAGTIAGFRVRGVLEPYAEGFALVLPRGWRADHRVVVGRTVDVALEPEGPQRADLEPDIAEALAAEPAAAAFFDGLAQFYRNAYLRWIDGTKRRPDVRAERIAEMVGLLRDGVKQRP